MLFPIFFDEKVQHSGIYKEATEGILKQNSQSNAHWVAFREKLMEP